MGYREWRQRQNERIDVMTARADARYEQAKRREDDLKAGQAERREQAADDALSDWGQRRALLLGDVHKDLAGRAAAVGMGVPDLPKSRRGVGVVRALGALVSPEDALGSHGGRIDAYEAWRDRIVVEEVMAAKAARGEVLSRLDRLSLRVARFGDRS